MDFKTHNNDDDEFKKLFTLRFSQLNAHLLDVSSPGEQQLLTSLTSSPFSPAFNNDTPRPKSGRTVLCQQTASRKMLNYSDDEEMQKFIDVAEQLDLNKTYNSKTMDSQDLSAMLAAMED